MRYEVIVQLKEEVLDPEGRAIQETLERLGHRELRNVVVSKRYVLDVEGERAGQVVDAIAREYLANPVSQTFEIRKL